MEENSKGIVNYTIDKNILFIFFGVIAVTTAVIIFKITNHNPCDIVNFDVNANQYRVGEIIRFKDFSKNATTHKWNFGDSSTARYDINPFHTYTKPGKYEVTLIVNGKCEYSKKLTIKRKKSTIDSTRIANFEIPNTIKVGELLIAKDLTKGASSWEWRFGETSEVNSTYKEPTYAYTTPGLKTVTLVVNGDPRYSTQKQINVLPAIVIEKIQPKKVERTPESQSASSELPRAPKQTFIPNAPPVENAASEESSTKKKKNKPSISRSAFAKKLIEVSEEKATAQDFQKYLCGGNLQTNTSAKGKKTTFIEFCEKIKGKKIKIKSLELFKNKQTNCIEYISVDYSKGMF